MLKAFLAALAIGVLLAVLFLLTIESRSVTEDYYVAHSNQIRIIETSEEDVAAITRGAINAFEEGEPIPESVTLIYPRLAENSLLLQSMHDSIRVDAPAESQLPTYYQALSKFLDAGRAFTDRQNSLATALRTLQEDSPIFVKDLRQIGMRDQSQRTFTLAIDVIEFATGQSDSNVVSLQQRIDALRNDAVMNSEVPGRLDGFVSAAAKVLSEHVAAEAALYQVISNNVSSHLATLSNEILNENSRTVGRAERARLLLTIFAVLLVAGTGYAMLKLQNSYRALNRSNGELAIINNSLEDRVASRTEELSAAYENLKESQVQLVQAEKMSSLGELVAGISHEINTPLWYLTSNATVVQDRLALAKDFVVIGEKMIAAVAARQAVKEVVKAGLVDMRAMLGDGVMGDIEEAEDLIHDSIEGLEELTELAQGLKDFSRLDRAKQGKFDVNEGLDKTLLIAKNRIKNKVAVHKHYGEVQAIKCSPSQINQVFLNLITNAADAIEGTGELMLRTWQAGQNICISIGDSGCGIPADLISKIRDPFFTTKEVGKGTGLGLSIVNQIVTSHGGELRFQSQPGKGTVVTVMLPIVAVDYDESDAERGALADPDESRTAQLARSAESNAPFDVPIHLGPDIAVEGVYRELPAVETAFSP